MSLTDVDLAVFESSILAPLFSNLFIRATLQKQVGLEFLDLLIFPVAYNKTFNDIPIGDCPSAFGLSELDNLFVC